MALITSLVVGMGCGADTDGQDGVRSLDANPDEALDIQNKRLRNSATSLCLSQGPRGGRDVMAEGCAPTSPTVRWDIIALASEGPPYRYTIRPSKERSKCLHLQEKGLELRPCSTEPAKEAQLFYITPVEDEYLISSVSSPLYLTALQPHSVSMLRQGEVNPVLQRWSFF